MQRGRSPSELTPETARALSKRVVQSKAPHLHPRGESDRADPYFALRELWISAQVCDDGSRRPPELQPPSHRRPWY